MKDFSLDDLALFAAVADAGSLQAAARATGVSAPTLSRRMAEVERIAGERLFDRGAMGYALTARGGALLAELGELRALRGRLASWAGGGPGKVRVRITAGTFTSRFLARHIGRVWSPAAPWLPEFLSANASLDIARREADAGVRARRPEQPWLAGRRTAAALLYAEFGADPAVRGYIALAEGAASTPAERWLRAERGDAIVTTVNHERLALDLARQGVGRVVLPVYVGSDGTGLVQLTPPIAEAEHEEWLVSHHEGRHDPGIRDALDALHRLLTMPIRHGVRA